MAGIPVLTLGPKNLNKWLIDVGFKMQYSELYDHLEFGEERIEAVIDTIVSKTPNTYQIKHNHRLMHDVPFLSNLIVKPLAERIISKWL